MKFLSVKYRIQIATIKMHYSVHGISISEKLDNVYKLANLVTLACMGFVD